MKNRLPLLGVFLLCFVCLLPMLVSRDYTPSNELRYLNIVDEAIADAHIWSFTNQGEPYADKPPFYFWLMMLCRTLVGKHSMLALSMIAFIPACVIILVLDTWVCSVVPLDDRKRKAAALMLMTSTMFLASSVLVRMDMLMCMWIVLAMWMHWKAEHSGSKLCLWLLPVFVFMALFTKGPVGLLMPLLYIAVYHLVDGTPKKMGRYIGFRTLGVVAGLSAVWIAFAFKEGGKDYIMNLLFHQTVGRAVNAFHHKEPFWYYGVSIWWVIAPWCFAVVPATAVALFKGDKLQKSLSLGVVSTFVMLSLFSSKLAIYLLPVVPLAVYCFATLEYKAWMRCAIGFVPILWLLIGIALTGAWIVSLVAPSVLDFVSLPFLKSVFVLFGGLVMLAGGIRAMRMLKSSWERPVSICAVSLLLMVGLVSFKMEEINDFVGYGNLCRFVPENSQVYTFGVSRAENINVYTGGEIYDFNKDVDSFLMIAPKEGTLIIKTSCLVDYPDLAHFLEGHSFETCGSYAVYEL